MSGRRHDSYSRRSLNFPGGSPEIAELNASGLSCRACGVAGRVPGMVARLLQPRKIQGRLLSRALRRGSSPTDCARLHARCLPPSRRRHGLRGGGLQGLSGSARVLAGRCVLHVCAPRPGSETLHLRHDSGGRGRPPVCGQRRSGRVKSSEARSARTLAPVKSSYKTSARGATIAAALTNSRSSARTTRPRRRRWWADR